MFLPLGISIAAIGGRTELPTVIQRIATLKRARWIDANVRRYCAGRHGYAGNRILTNINLQG